MVKNSFTLFETLISTVLLLIIIVGFTKSSSYDNFDKEFMLLNEIENSFKSKTYSSNFTSSNEKLKIIKNDTNEESITAKKIVYKDKQIELLKYEVIK